MSTPSFEQTQKSKLLPNLSLRAILAFATIGAIIAWLGRLAWLGYALPWVILLALASIVAFFLASAIVFTIVWIPARINIRAEQLDQVDGSPFSKDNLPPQILPPRGS